MLLSVIIPTHNRAKYVLATIRSLLDISGDIEVIVSDTSERDEISSAITEADDLSRFRLVRPGPGLNMVQNFECALAHANGQYLIFLGDDDFVSESAVGIARWAAAHSVDAVKCSFPGSYYWPDFRSRYFGDGYAGKLSLGDFDGACRDIDAPSALVGALRSLGGGVQAMPRAYLGLVSRSLVDRIRLSHGALFGGVSPDIFSATLISARSVSSVEISYPFIVPGSGGASGSGQSASGRHKGRLSDSPHIRSFPGLQWDARVPEFYSIETVWSYSLLKASELVGFEGFANFARLHVKCLLAHPVYWREIAAAARYSAQFQGWSVYARDMVMACAAEFAAQVRRVSRRVVRRSATTGSVTISDLKDSCEARLALEHYLGSCGIDLQLSRRAINDN